MALKKDKTMASQSVITFTINISLSLFSGRFNCDRDIVLIIKLNNILSVYLLFVGDVVVHHSCLSSCHVFVLDHCIKLMSRLQNFLVYLYQIHLLLILIDII
jgi:hypothetical protein